GERAANDDGASRVREAGHGERPAAAVEEVGVTLIGEQPDAAAAADVQDLGELVFGKDGSGGIRRRIHYDHARFRRDGGLDVASEQAEAVVLVGLDEDGLAAGVFDDVGKTDPAGDGDDDFIAGIHKHVDGVEDGVLLADAHDTFGGLVGGAELRGVPFADGLAQGLDAAGGRVLGEVLLQGADGGALDVVRSGEVGLAGAEVDNVNAASFVTLRLDHDRQGGRFGDAFDALRELHDVLPSLNEPWP